MRGESEALQSVEPRQIAAWLVAKGWERVALAPERSATWRKSAGEEEFIVEVPLDVAFRDYARRVHEVMDTLSTESGRPRRWLIEEMKASTTDLIRLRATGPGVGAGRVPLELGARLFEHTRELILAAACAAHTPRPVYRSRKPSEAVEFLRRVRLAAPEAGSFIINIQVQVQPALQPALAEDLGELPFARRATWTLATAALAARQAAEEASQGGDARAFLSGSARGVSANLCDALSGLVDGEEATALELCFAWAPALPVPPETPTAIHLNADLAAVLGQGAKWLRATHPAPDFEMEGAVVRLESDAAESGGVAVLAAQVDGAPRKVRVKMAASDYQLAIQAHQQGHLLRCEGELIRQGGRLSLDRARYIALIADEEPA